MKKPEKYNSLKGYHNEWMVYDADEMDAYIAHLEQARDEARYILDNAEMEYRQDRERRDEWLEKYASEKVEGGG